MNFPNINRQSYIDEIISGSRLAIEVDIMSDADRASIKESIELGDEFWDNLTDQELINGFEIVMHGVASIYERGLA